MKKGKSINKRKMILENNKKIIPPNPQISTAHHKK